MKERIEQLLIQLGAINEAVGNMADELVEHRSPIIKDCREGLFKAKHYLTTALMGLTRIAERFPALKKPAPVAYEIVIREGLPFTQTAQGTHHSTTEELVREILRLRAESVARESRETH